MKQKVKAIKTEYSSSTPLQMGQTYLVLPTLKRRETKLLVRFHLNMMKFKNPFRCLNKNHLVYIWFQVDIDFDND